MSPDQRLLCIGAMLNSALYCAGAFVAGIVTNNPLAWKLSLITIGATFLAYFSQISPAWFPLELQVAIMLLSIFAGIGAGFALLLR